MTHDNLILFFLQLAALLAVALILGQLMRRLGQPAVLGELLGGIVLGPTVFGALRPEWYHWLFPDGGVTADMREGLLGLGMLFFLFVAGLEVELSQLRRRGLSVILTSGLGIALPLGLGFGLVWLWPEYMIGPQAAGDQKALFALFMGAALSISALPVIARILMDLKLLQKELGLVVMTAATINDLIGWTLFAVLLGLFQPAVGGGRSLWLTVGLVLLFTTAVLVMGRFAGRPALRWLRANVAWPSGFIGVTAVLILVAAAVTEAIGIHAIFGAFLVGVALAQHSEEWRDASEVIHHFALSFFAPIYFASIGLKANFATHFDVVLVVVVLLVACLGKIVGAGLGARLGGMNGRQALAVGFGMNARGAMEMILASVALQYGLIDERIFVALIVMALVTSVLSGPVMQRLMRET